MLFLFSSSFVVILFDDGHAVSKKEKDLEHARVTQRRLSGALLPR